MSITEVASYKKTLPSIFYDDSTKINYELFVIYKNINTHKIMYIKKKL